MPLPTSAMLRRLAVPLARAAIAAVPSPVTVWLAGDSTMAEKQANKRPETGWGEAFGALFRPGEVRIVNRAMNGRSTRTFIAEGRWQAIVDSLHPGDYVFIQFGHNDESKEKIDRYTAPDDFRRNLARMVADVRAKGGLPVLMTPVYRRSFDASGQPRDTHGEYPDITRAVASELHVPLVDMHRGSREVLARFGPDSSKALFLQVEAGESPSYPAGVHDNTHFNPRGAALMARIAADGIRALGLPLASHLLDAR